ncbi:MAG: GxxExxY protein [bacterium]
MEKWREDELTDKIISACINVHKELGPGFLESVYHNALRVELARQNLVTVQGVTKGKWRN